MRSLTLDEIIHAVGGSCLNHSLDDLSITSVSIDSRDIQKNALYIPIRGDKFDGHSFINDAFENGCIAALTEENIEPINNQILIQVPDTKYALMCLAGYYRRQFDIPVVAITGSVGKTTTKDLVASVISAKYKVHKTQGNFNNEIGLPLTIFGLEEDHQALVLEMGMNHFDEIHRLSMIANPDIGIITNIGVSHIEHLGSRKCILKAKSEILDGMKSNGTLIVNGEDDMLQRLVPKHKLVTYGRSKTHNFYADHIEFNPNGGMSATFHTPENNLEIIVPGLGEHMIDNALAAIVVAKALNLSDENIKDGFALYKPSEMRMDLQVGENEISVINDVYNASPDSIKAALRVLTSMPNGKRRIAILGDMFELGEHAEELHREIGAYVAKQTNIDILITVGELTKFIREEAVAVGMPQDQTYHFSTQEALISNLSQLLLPQDFVLVKASRGMALEKTVDEIGKVNFNE